MPRKKKKAEELPAVRAQPYYTDKSGQITFFPDEVKKAHGPVIDTVIGRQLMQPLLVDDTVSVENDDSLPIMTKVMIDYDELQAQGEKKLTAFDREVLDAVATLCQNNDTISAKMIYRVIVGNRKYYKISQNQLQSVIDSLERCGRTQIRINITDMTEKNSPIAARLRKKHIKATYVGNVIPYEALSLRTTDDGDYLIHILKTPTIFAYAEAIGQIYSYPISLLDTNVNKTMRAIVLQSFLLRTIESMYRGSRSSRIIPIVSIYDVAEVGDAPAQHKQRIRVTTETILDDWVTKKYIRSYHKILSGRTISGYEINLFTKYPLLAK